MTVPQGSSLAGEARRWLGRQLRAGGFHWASAAGLRELWSGNGLGTTDGDGDIFAFADEVKMVVGVLPVDANHIAESDLFRGEKIGHWIDDVAFDGALEMARAVTLVGAFLQKEVTPLGGDAEKELALCGFENALLNHGEFDV